MIEAVQHLPDRRVRTLAGSVGGVGDGDAKRNISSYLCVGVAGIIAEEPRVVASPITYRHLMGGDLVLRAGQDRRQPAPRVEAALNLSEATFGADEVGDGHSRVCRRHLALERGSRGNDSGDGGQDHRHEHIGCTALHGKVLKRRSPSARMSAIVQHATASRANGAK